MQQDADINSRRCLVRTRAAMTLNKHLIQGLNPFNAPTMAVATFELRAIQIWVAIQRKGRGSRFGGFIQVKDCG